MEAGSTIVVSLHITALIGAVACYPERGNNEGMVANREQLYGLASRVTEPEAHAQSKVQYLGLGMVNS